MLWEGGVKPYRYPEVGEWEGDGLDHDIGISAAGEILTEYASTCANKVRYCDLAEISYGNRSDDQWQNGGDYLSVACHLGSEAINWVGEGVSPVHIVHILHM